MTQPSSAIPRSTHEGISSELNLFSDSVTQYTIESESRVYCRPASNPTIDSVNEINYYGSDDLYPDLQESDIEFIFKVVKADGTALLDADANKVAPRCGAASFFKSIEMDINGQALPGLGDLTSYKAYIGNLCSYSKDTLDRRGEIEGWCYDDPAAMDDNNGANDPMKTRYKWIAKSRECQMIFRPPLEIFQSERLLVNGVNFRLKCYFNNQAFMLASADSTSYKVVPIALHLRVRVKELSPDLRAAYIKTRQIENAKYPISRLSTRQVVISKNVQVQTIPNLVSGALPDVVYIAFVKDKALAGDATLNPFNFVHADVQSVTLLVNNRNIPDYPYTSKWGDEDYRIGAEYMDFLEAIGCKNTDKMIAITPHMYRKGYTIFAYKISSVNTVNGVLNSTKTGSIHVRITFSRPPNDNYSMIAFIQSPGQIEITKDNNVIVKDHV